MNKGNYNITVRLSHLPTVCSDGVQFALWTDVKELLLLCADTYCSIVLEALNQIKLQTFIHACSKEEQISFSRQFKIVEEGTCLVNVELLKNPEILNFLFEYVRKEHAESCSLEALRCVQSLNNISQKYVNTSFKIPLKMKHMRLLPALKRSFITHEQERQTDDNIMDTKDTSQLRRNVATCTLVPICLLCEMFPECKRYLNGAFTQYCQGLHGDGTLSKIYKCTIEEGIQLTRFISTYKGYDSSWSCYTSNNLLMSWTEFWNKQDYRIQNILSCRLSNIGMIILNCQDFPSSVAARKSSLKYPIPKFVTSNGEVNKFKVKDDVTVANQNLYNNLGSVQQIKNGSTVLPQDAIFIPVLKKKTTGSVNVIKKEKDVDIDYIDTQYRLPKTDGHVEHSQSLSSIKEHQLPMVENVKLLNGGLIDQHYIDMNNSAANKGVDISSTKPGCGDTRESDVNFKKNNGKELLSMNKLIISDALNSTSDLSKSADSTPYLVQAEKCSNYKYKHIFVPVCDNDLKVDYSNSENPGIDHSNTLNDETQQGIHVSITPKTKIEFDDNQRPTFTCVMTPNTTKRKEDCERKYLKLSTAFINDDMPVALRVEGKIPTSVATKYGLANAESEDDKLKEVNTPVYDKKDVANSRTPKICDNVDSLDKPRYTTVTPKQLELTAPMLQGIDIDPNIVHEGRKLPYKSARNDNKYSSERNVILFPNLPQNVTPCTPVPIIEGTQISFKPSQHKNSTTDKSISFISHSDPASTTIFTLNKSVGDIDENNLNKSVNLSHNNAEIQNDNVTSPSNKFVATGKVIKTMEKNADFNSSDFMKERITMWRDSVERELHVNKTERQTKSAGVRRSRQVGPFRPSSSLYYSCGNFEKDTGKTSPLTCSVFACEIPSSKPSPDKLQANEKKKIEATPVQEKHIEVQNYGSSSSTTPDIYDEFARKRRPKLLKPDTIQIKPKPVTRPIPTTLCQPIVRKPSPAVITTKPVTQSHNTAGYCSYNSVRQTLPQTMQANNAEVNKPCLKQTHRQTDGLSLNNLYQDSKTYQLKQTVPVMTDNTNSNTSCSYSSSSVHRKEITRKIPSAKEARKPFVPEFCTFIDRPKTAKSLSTVNSNSSLLHKIDSTESVSSPTDVNTVLKSLQKPINDISGDVSKVHSFTSSPAMQSSSHSKCHLLEKVTSFVNNYVSPKRSDSLEDINSIHAILSTNPLQCIEDINTDVNKPSKDKGNKLSRTNSYIKDLPCQNNCKYVSAIGANETDHRLSKVDDQLYYKVPEDDHYHKVTGNMIIPPHAQFFIQSQETHQVVANKEEDLENKTVDRNKELHCIDNLKVKIYDKLHMHNSSYCLFKSNNDSALANKAYENDSIFEKILMTSECFEDKADQMKHIILETEQAILNVDKLLDEDENTELEKIVSDKTLSYTKKPTKNNDSSVFKEVSPRVISPGLELSKRVVDKKKSFKEVVEEKRAQRRETEKEISKKCFWGSAHYNSSRSDKLRTKSDTEKIQLSMKEKNRNINKNVSKNTKPIKENKSNTAIKTDAKHVNSSISKSELNKESRRQKDGNNNKKKDTQVSKRPKSTESKLKVAESCSTRCERVPNNVKHHIKAPNHGLSKYSSKKTTDKKDIRKRRLSKSAHQFPRSREKDNCIDDCTNKILTALRRLSIEKPQQNIDSRVSPKLVARQRKLRYCVEKNLISQKGNADSANDINLDVNASSPERVKFGNDNNKVTIDESSGVLEKYDSIQTDKHGEGNEVRMTNIVRKECYVSLRKLDDNKIAQQQLVNPKMNSKELQNEFGQEKSECFTTSVPCDANTEDEVTEVNEQTFITNFDMSDLNMKGDCEKVMFDGNFEVDGMKFNKDFGNEFRADENINCTINDNFLHDNIVAPDGTHSSDNKCKPLNNNSDNDLELQKLEENDYAIGEEIELINVGDNEENFLYMTEGDNVINTEYEYVLIQNDHFDSGPSSNSVDLDNPSHTNGGQSLNIDNNSISYNVNLMCDKHNIVSGEQLEEYSYLGLPMLSNDPQSNLQVVNKDEEIYDTENDNYNFIDETDCGVEVYIDSADVDRVDSICKECHDKNGQLQLKNSNETEKSIEQDDKVGNTNKDEVRVENSHTSIIKEDNNKSRIEKENVISVHHYSDTILEDNLFNYSQDSPTQSEMDEYFSKVVERAGLNPFSGICSDELTKKNDGTLENLTETKNCNGKIINSESTNKKEDRVSTSDKTNENNLCKTDRGKLKKGLDSENANTYRKSEKNDKKIFSSKKDAGKNCPGSDNSESDISSLIPSDVDDIDYNPDTDSNSDTDENINIPVANKHVHTKVKDNYKKTNQVKTSKKKHLKMRESTPDNGNWRKYLKDNYMCDNKTGKVSSKKNKQTSRGNQLKCESSIVREYCLNHSGNEESLTNIYDKIRNVKFNSKKIATSQENLYRDPASFDDVQSTKKTEKRTKSKRKARVRKSEASIDTNKIVEEEKEAEDMKTAEGFIKTQQLYFNILKRSSVSHQGHDDEENISMTQVSDLPEVLEAVALHGERIISKAESEAEKSLEGTGSLDQLYLEDEGTIVEDLNNQCRYQMIEDEDHIQLGGIAYFKDFELPFVYINGYKYTPVKDALQIFQPRCCPTKCTIPRNILHKYKPLVKSFSTWEQVYKLELIKMKKGPTVKTGDMLVKLDSFISLLPELIEAISKQHTGTKLKNSQLCSVKQYKTLLMSIK